MSADVNKFRGGKAPRVFKKIGRFFCSPPFDSQHGLQGGYAGQRICAQLNSRYKVIMRFNDLFNMMLVNRLMLQVWKIKVPTPQDADAFKEGWALAENKREALELAGNPSASVKRMPEHLWIAKERVIWPSPDRTANTAAH
ncbi:hypothetical protein MUY35_02985 [Aliiroseovarius sp. S1339]|uniref:hypothetical protein n=1 Tax=Aliiroseovarius sp. S1339 TaxID=2936990 RepID=UPI0020BEA8B5|nr:hypothetical protein [Aliiroseovarius sp. S1339]MCK8462811.1 hypothetical protein [Aliiroseovarius sp. S1339]